MTKIKNIKDINDYNEILNSGSSVTNNEEFEKNGYLVIKNLYDPKDLFSEIPKEKHGSIRYITKNDYHYSPEECQVQGCISRYNYPPYKYPHSQIRIKLEKIIGKDLFNTYYFDRFYYAGQELKRHTDRDSCEISVTVHVSSNTTKCWPIWIKTPDTYNEDKTEII